MYFFSKKTFSWLYKQSYGPGQKHPNIWDCSVIESGQETEGHQFSTLRFASSLIFIQVHGSVEEAGVPRGTYGMWCVWP